MIRFTACLFVIIGIIAITEAAGIDRFRSGFGQSGAQAQASASSGGRFGPPAPPPPAFGGRGISNGVGNRGIGNSKGTSISIAKSVSINSNRGGASSSQASSSALSRGK